MSARSRGLYVPRRVAVLAGSDRIPAAVAGIEVDAVREGRSAMRDKEAELREVQDLRLTPQPATANHSPTFIVVDADGRD